MSHLWATINRGWFTCSFVVCLRCPAPREETWTLVADFVMKLAQLTNVHAFTCYGRLNWKGPLFFLYFTQHPSSYRYHLYPLSYGYHLYPPNPKENVASSDEVPRISDKWILVLSKWTYQIVRYFLIFWIKFVLLRSGKALLAHILLYWSCLSYNAPQAALLTLAKARFPIDKSMRNQDEYLAARIV